MTAFFAVPAHAARATALRTPLSRSVHKGHTARFTTRLTSAGRAVPGRRVKLFSYHNGAWHHKRTGTTTSTGRVRFSYAPWGSRAVKVVFSGDSRYAPTRSRKFRIMVVAARASLGVRAVREAARHLGKDYTWAAAGPNTFDCSGFTQYVFGRLGRRLPHNAAMQAGVVRHIRVSAKRRGDLIFLRSRSGRIDHVGIYVGGNYMYAASQSADTVKRQFIYTSNIVVGRVR